MLVPAITRKEEIIQKFKELYYTEDMFYLGGGITGFIPDIDNDNNDQVRYAIINHDKLIGYFKYKLLLATSCASHFCLISFDKGNYVIGQDLFSEFKKLLNEYHVHRIEWDMIAGNPVEKHYDRFINQYTGYKNKHILKDACIDRAGKYHDYIIYEIINNV